MIVFLTHKINPKVFCPNFGGHFTRRRGDGVRRTEGSGLKNNQNKTVPLGEEGRAKRREFKNTCYSIFQLLPPYGYCLWRSCLRSLCNHKQVCIALTYSQHSIFKKRQSSLSGGSSKTTLHSEFLDASTSLSMTIWIHRFYPPRLAATPPCRQRGEPEWDEQVRARTSHGQTSILLTLNKYILQKTFENACIQRRLFVHLQCKMIDEGPASPSFSFL